MVSRMLKTTNSYSFFLFGPRATGKTTLLKKRYGNKDIAYIDLLDLETEDAFLRNPSELAQRAASYASQGKEWVIIDEIQKQPRLLDTVHQKIEETNLKFILTGSSARKLKRGVSNLLAGRAFMYHLHPFTHRELKDSFSLNSVLNWGALPKIFDFEEPEDKRMYLQAYAHTYLKEEIQAEQLVRKLSPFRQFLEVAAQCNGKIINYSKIADDVGVDTKTVQSYFGILEDTMLGFLLPAYHTSIRKQQRLSPKFYFFDIGVKRALQRTLKSSVIEGTYAYGDSFEHFILLEMFRLNDYYNLEWRFSYLRTKDNAEIDCIIDRPLMKSALVEIKSGTLITQRDVGTLNVFAKDLENCDAFCLSNDPHDKKIGKTWCLPWKKGLREIGFV
ncbi:MAG: AAA family ATPase [Chitinivibrionales bacterium]|nr:AAA family ATPase [Chitinivibrionales bacterium]